MKDNIIENPFVGCTARDMTYDEINKYWCNPYRLYSLDEKDLFSSRTPIIIEGARGTGKTMLLKRMSYFVQKDLAEDKSTEGILSHLRESGVGVYFRYKEDFCNLFYRIRCEEEKKSLIFESYYALFICRQILEILNDIYARDDLAGSADEMEKTLCEFFGLKDVGLSEIHTAVKQKVKMIDQLINGYYLYGEENCDNYEKNLLSGNFIGQMVRTISENVGGWERIQFNILIDEYENAKKYQVMLNTLLKQVDETTNLSYRIGMRPAGMTDNRTYVSGERLQVDRDFKLFSLKYVEFAQYKEFALSIAKRRLESVGLYRDNRLTDITEILGLQENLDAEAEETVRDQRHFRILAGKYDETELQKVIEEISCEEKLMEMYNIIRVLRGTDYREIGEICRRYRKLRDQKRLGDSDGDVKKYKLDYSSKYRMTLLYALLAIYKKKKKYYSLNTFLYLSSGAINDFISLCRNVFYFIDESVLAELKNGKRISTKIQTEAAIRTANNQLRKVAMSNRYGKEMNSFVDNMGRIFGYYHQDVEVKYPETNQFAFADESAVYQDDELCGYVIELINTGAIIKKDRIQHISIGKQKGSVYQLNRIFAPIFQFSYRTRGGYNCILTKGDFKELLFKSIDPQRYVGAKRDPDQIDVYRFMGETGNANQNISDGFDQ